MHGAAGSRSKEHTTSLKVHYRKAAAWPYALGFAVERDSDSRRECPETLHRGSWSVLSKILTSWFWIGIDTVLYCVSLRLLYKDRTELIVKKSQI